MATYLKNLYPPSPTLNKIDRFISMLFFLKGKNFLPVFSIRRIFAITLKGTSYQTKLKHFSYIKFESSFNATVVKMFRLQVFKLFLFH